MKRRTTVILIISAICFLLGIVCCFLYWKLISWKKDYRKIDLTTTNKLMIVAHPDDEAIWGGAHLLEDNYLVVCATCGTNKKRVIEFKKVMLMTGDKYIMLGYPDRTRGQRDNWQRVKPQIIQDVEKIIALKNWDEIVTHNPDGEYGHVHHKIINKIVTFLSDKEKLIYFGKYYTKKNIDENIFSQIDENLLDKKTNVLIEIYKTQGFIKTTFNQMFPYENWISYKEWKEEVVK